MKVRPAPLTTHSRRTERCVALSSRHPAQDFVCALYLLRSLSRGDYAPMTLDLVLNAIDLVATRNQREHERLRRPAIRRTAGRADAGFSKSFLDRDSNHRVVPQGLAHEKPPAVPTRAHRSAIYPSLDSKCIDTEMPLRQRNRCCVICAVLHAPTMTCRRADFTPNPRSPPPLKSSHPVVMVGATQRVRLRWCRVRSPGGPVRSVM